MLVWPNWILITSALQNLMLISWPWVMSCILSIYHLLIFVPNYFSAQAINQNGLLQGTLGAWSRFWGWRHYPGNSKFLICIILVSWTLQQAPPGPQRKINPQTQVFIDTQVCWCASQCWQHRHWRWCWWLWRHRHPVWCVDGQVEVLPQHTWRYSGGHGDCPMVGKYIYFICVHC